MLSHSPDTVAKSAFSFNIFNALHTSTEAIPFSLYSGKTCNHSIIPSPIFVSKSHIIEPTNLVLSKAPIHSSEKYTFVSVRPFI